MQTEFLDQFSRRHSPIHGLDARFKIVVAALLIFAVMLTSINRWPAFIVETCLALGIYAASGLPWRYLAGRLATLIPFLFLVTLGVPLSHGLQTGWMLEIQIIIRGLLALTIMLTLIATTPFSRLLVALEQLHVPQLFVWVLAFMYRYLFVLSDEYHRMRRARQARQFSSSLSQDWWWAGNSVGVLFLRSFERAERVYAAMCARGWNEHSPQHESRS